MLDIILNMINPRVYNVHINKDIKNIPKIYQKYIKNFLKKNSYIIPSIDTEKKVTHVLELYDGTIINLQCYNRSKYISDIILSNIDF